MAQIVDKFLDRLYSDVLGNKHQYRHARNKENVGCFYNNATIYYKTRYISNDLYRGLCVEEMPLKCTDFVKSPESTDNKVYEGTDIIIPIPLCNDVNNEFLERRTSEPKSISAFFNSIKHNPWLNRITTYGDIVYTGDATLLYDVTNKKLLYLVTESNLVDNKKWYIHVYFDESIFREDNAINKLLRSIYKELFARPDFFGEYRKCLPEICMGIPNISYRKDWKEVENGRFKTKEDYIQHQIDTFCLNYE